MIDAKTHPTAANTAKTHPTAAATDAKTHPTAAAMYFLLFSDSLSVIVFN
jgi:hypothetical protein